MTGAKITGAKELSADLQKAVDTCIEGAKKIVGQGCNNIKKDAQRIIRENSHRGYLPHYPRAISYDVAVSGYVVSGEIGPKTEKLQGGLGGLLENGSVNNAPIPHLDPALSLEEPRFAPHIEELGVRLLEGGTVQGGPVEDPG
ncbi:MAG TPA: hypothetical protein VHK64_05935 [Nocardioidaceae bacterium]|nr:hypothetical protein [Nocardioidaceae bacterium]